MCYLTLPEAKSTIEGAGDSLRAGVQFPKGEIVTATFPAPIEEDYEECDYCVTDKRVIDFAFHLLKTAKTTTRIAVHCT